METVLQQINYEPSPVKGGYTDSVLFIDLDLMALRIVKLPPEFKAK